jgi:hypothetical protein
MTFTQQQVSAAHEAARALVLLARGMKFKSIEVFEESREGASGLIELDEEPLFGEQAFSSVLGLLAGIPGTRLLLPHRSQLSLIMTNCTCDWAQAKAKCAEQGFDVGLLLRLSSKMVRRLAPSIYRVADELERRGRLTYEQVVEICPEAHAEGMEFQSGLLQLTW